MPWSEFPAFSFCTARSAKDTFHWWTLNNAWKIALYAYPQEHHEEFEANEDLRQEISGGHQGENRH
jgi:hypothetical protein